MGFEKIAPYLKDPLILIGFALFLGFLFIRSLVNKGVIPVLKQNQGFSILKVILLYGFIMGLLVIGLGFGLKYREMSEDDQKRLINMLSKEFGGNMMVLSELKQNTEMFLQQQIDLSTAIRTEGIAILPVMFPKVNLELDKSVNSNELARDAIMELVRQNLATNSGELKKLDEFSAALLKTVRAVKSTNQNLRDSARQRYRFNADIWQANLTSYKKLNLVDVTLFQKAYSQQANIRNDYEIVAKSAIDFQNALLDYFKKDNEITWDQLSYVLTMERHSYELIIEYSKNLVNTMTDLIEINKALERKEADI
jgi:hypothetical protein